MRNDVQYNESCDAYRRCLNASRQRHLHVKYACR